MSKHLASFNTDAAKRDIKWKSAKSADDLGKMNEATFLEIAQAIGAVAILNEQTVTRNRSKIRVV
jgi:hypothetical protein